MAEKALKVAAADTRVNDLAKKIQAKKSIKRTEKLLKLRERLWSKHRMIVIRVKNVRSIYRGQKISSLVSEQFMEIVKSSPGINLLLTLKTVTARGVVGSLGLGQQRSCQGLRFRRSFRSSEEVSFAAQVECYLQRRGHARQGNQ